MAFLKEQRQPQAILSFKGSLLNMRNRSYSTVAEGIISTVNGTDVALSGALQFKTIVGLWPQPGRQLQRPAKLWELLGS